jgi:hypothetical protein
MSFYRSVKTPRPFYVASCRPESSSSLGWPLFSRYSTSARVAEAVPNRMTLMPRSKCMASCWMLLIPAFLAAQANIANPAFGVFFGDYPRRFRADFDVIF